MDNEQDLKQQEMEEQYIKENAKYKVGDIVGFIYGKIPENNVRLGVINHISFRYIVSSNNKSQFTVITYSIITPNGVIMKDECELFVAADYICRRYCKIPV